MAVTVPWIPFDRSSQSVDGTRWCAVPPVVYVACSIACPVRSLSKRCPSPKTKRPRVFPEKKVPLFPGECSKVILFLFILKLYISAPLVSL